MFALSIWIATMFATIAKLVYRDNSRTTVISQIFRPSGIIQIDRIYIWDVLEKSTA